MNYDYIIIDCPPTLGLLVSIIKEELTETNDTILRDQVVDFLHRTKASPNVSDLHYVKDKSLDFCKRQAFKDALEQAVELISTDNTPLYNIGLMVVFSLIPLYYFNYKNNKKVFLGDGGSLLLGTFISIYIFYVLSEDYITTSFFVINKALLSILIIIYPLIDLLRVFIIRIYNKKSPFIADKNHIHHIILNVVKSHYLVVIVIQFISIFFIFACLMLFK